MALTFPPFYLLHIGFEGKTSEFQDIEREIGLNNIVYNIEETSIFVGKLTKPKRAVLELGKLKVFMDPIAMEPNDLEEAKSPAKKQKIGHNVTDEKDIVCIDSDTASEDGGDEDAVTVKRPLRKSTRSSAKRSSAPKRADTMDGKETVKVLQLSWVLDSMKKKEVLPMDDYLVYKGTRISKPSTKSKTPSVTPALESKAFSRALADSPPPKPYSQHYRKQFGGSHSHSQTHKRPAALLRSESTLEHDAAQDLPPLPDYCKKEYCCQRPTPSPTPNDPFIGQLKKILLARKLLSDDIGERAYNKAIAIIAAYPYTITHVSEIRRLPGCGPKYAVLYKEWQDTGRIGEVEEFESSQKMQVLNLFYGIHDVGGKVANQFYDKGWRDLDDLVQYGWNTLDRNQQVGLKWYDDFQTKIPREEVERIGDVVLEHANKIREGFQMVICGGYRRGKKMCGDVDIILTHPEEKATDHFIDDIFYDLAESNWIQYKLTKSNRNSERGQEPLNWRGGMSRSGGGFDSLDKILVVWRDPNFPGMEDRDAKNPNTHRRVDIIISPWKTAGCAIVGWTGGTMFERDIRRYCRKKLEWKFDSSGVRTLGDGAWVDLEGDEMDLLGKEKKVFEGLALEWIEPTLRCTDG